MSGGAEAARLWGAETEPRLIKDRENIVYEIHLPSVGRAALRLHRPGYQSAAAIRSELWWMGALAGAGLPVPRPVPSRREALVEMTHGRLATVVTWVDGAQMGEAGVPLGADAAAITARYRRLGALIAHLHNVTDALTLPADFERPSWDRDGFLGDSPLWGRFWENPALSADESALLLEARQVADRRLETLVRKGADYGLIHADVLRENVLERDGQLSLIDFDDSGFGFRALDLATAEVQGMEDPMNPVASLAIYEGYMDARRPDAPPLGDVPLFVALRTFASAGWIVTRTGPDDPRARFYAERAVRAARWLIDG